MLSSIKVVFPFQKNLTKAKVWYFPMVGEGGGLVKLKLKLNSAKAEAKNSSLGLAELGNKTHLNYSK